MIVGALYGSTLAIGMIKRGLNESYDLSLQENMENEIDLLNMVFETRDRVEGMRAFVEKREPKFTGR